MTLEACIYDPSWSGVAWCFSRVSDKTDPIQRINAAKALPKEASGLSRVTEIVLVSAKNDDSADNEDVIPADVIGLSSQVHRQRPSISTSQNNGDAFTNRSVFLASCRLGDACQSLPRTTSVARGQPLQNVFGERHGTGTKRHSGFLQGAKRSHPLRLASYSYAEFTVTAEVNVDSPYLRTQLPWQASARSMISPSRNCARF